jgi:hypothetical protein
VDLPEVSGLAAISGCLSPVWGSVLSWCTTAYRQQVSGRSLRLRHALSQLQQVRRCPTFGPFSSYWLHAAYCP